MTAIPLREAPADAQPIARAARATGALRDQIAARPFAAVVVATCIGFALGGGVSRGILTLLLGAGARAAGARLSEVLLENLKPQGQEETQ